MASYYRYETNLRLKDGFPVIAKWRVNPAEPDVGIMGHWIDDFELCHHITGKPHGQWIYDKLEKPGFRDHLLEQMLEQSNDYDAEDYQK